MLESCRAYYIEYRRNDVACVKLDPPRRSVDYADYRIGLYYLAPSVVAIQMPSAWNPGQDAKTNNPKIVA